jgi:hypothetical protein
MPLIPGTHLWPYEVVSPLGAGRDYEVGLRRLDAPSAVRLGSGEAVQISPASRDAAGRHSPNDVRVTGASERAGAE